MNSYDFSGQTAVITGGCNGIGAAVVKKLVHSGARVCIWDMNIEDCEGEIAKLSAETCQKVQTDVSDFESVTAALAKTKSAFGAVDVLINSAGVAGPTYSLADYPIDQWRKVQAVNLDGTFHCCKVVVPEMIGSGLSLIHISEPTRPY